MMTGGELLSRVELDQARFAPSAIQGISEFSHPEVVYVFGRVDEGSFERDARRPRNNPRWPAVGMFAQRNKRRPNRIGVSCCELVSVSETILTVRALDAIDGTPARLDDPPLRTAGVGVL